MSTQTQQSLKAEDLWIFDADAHVTESDAHLIPYIKERYPGIGSDLEQVSQYDSHIRSRTHPGPHRGELYESESDEDLGEIEEVMGYKIRSEVVPQKLAELSDFDIDGGIITPTMLLSVNSINNPKHGFAYTAGYNAWLEDNFLGESDSVKGSVLVSRHHPHKSAEEIDRMNSYDDVIAISFPTGSMLPPLGDERYTPIYEAAEDNDLPILLHGTGATFMWDFPMQYQHVWTFLEGNVLANVFQAMFQLNSVINKGLPTKYPDLTLVFQEAGIAWVPYLLWRMDDYYLEYGDDNPYISKLPSEYVHDKYYFTTQPLGHTSRSNQMAKIFELIGPENIMYSSDLPHPTFDPPEEVINEIDGHFERDVIRQIMGETAREVFDL